MNYQKVYMNQIYSSNMMGYLSQMWRNQLLCDAVIKTGNIITKAHRIVLIAACPMLQNMENASLGSHLEVRMAADIKQDSVNAFLQYIYEGYMMLTEENCKDIEKMAKLLQVESVVKCCADFYKCLSDKTGVMHGGPNFNYQDSAEFKHFRITQIQKLAQEGALKRSMENGRPPSPGGKRQKVQRSASPAEVVVLGSYNRGDDRSGMSSSYNPGGQDPFERVPRIGSGISHSSDAGITEDSLEVVHKDPPERDADGWPKESRLPPVHRTQSISVSSQLSKETNVQIVNVPNESDRFRVQQSSQSVQMSPARPTPPRTSIAPEPAQQTFTQGLSAAQKSEAQRIASDVMASLPSIHMQASASMSQQQAMNASAQKINIDPLPPPLHGPSFQSSASLRPSAISQPPSHPTQQTPPRLASKPFAAGSALQASESHPSPLSDKRDKESNIAQGTSQVTPTSAPQESRIPSQNISLQPATTEQIQNVEKLLAGGDVAMPDRKSEPSTSEASPDLSIIKIEEADTGGLDMYVDLPDDTKAMIQAHEGGTCESEDEGDYGLGDASNEGSNFSGEQMGAWQGQDVSFQGQDASFSADGSFQGQEGSYQDTPGTEMAVMASGAASKGGQFLCDQCAALFYSRQGLNKHMALKHEKGEAPYRCKQCNKDFFIKTLFNAHMLKHSGVKSFQCDACPRKYFYAKDLRAHVKAVHSNEAIKCELCAKTFRYEYNLRKHLKAVHMDTQQISSCDMCNFKSVYKKNVERHRRKHFSNKPFKCPYCSYAAMRADYLSSHLKRTHDSSTLETFQIKQEDTDTHGTKMAVTVSGAASKGGQFCCDQCAALFYSRQGLNKHMALKHEKGEAPYRCKQCNKNFIVKSRFKAHVLKHSGHKPFQCDICPRKYVYAKDLRAHEKAVHGNEAIKCKLCTKTFRYEDSLRRHLKAVHMGEIFTCILCGKEFKYENNYKRHVKSAHKSC